MPSEWKNIIVNGCATTRLSFPLFFFFQPIVIVVLSRFSPRLKRTYVFREVEHWIIIALVCTKFSDKSTLIKFNPKCVKKYLNFVCSIQYWTSIIVEAMMIILIELTKHQGSMWKWNNLGKYWFRINVLLVKIFLHSGSNFEQCVFRGLKKVVKIFQIFVIWKCLLALKMVYYLPSWRARKYFENYCLLKVSSMTEQSIMLQFF